MYPTLIRLGPLTLHSYGLMMAFGFLSALWVWKMLAKLNGLTPELRSSLLIWMLVSGVIGARVFHVVEHWQAFAPAPLTILRIDQGGLVFYGGAIGASLGLALFARLKRRPVLELMDLVATALPLGHAWGRLGCLLNGCCHGRPSLSGACAIRFPAGSLAWQQQLSDGLIERSAIASLPVVPTQAIESLGNLAIFALLFALYPRRRFRGMVAGLYLLLYPVLRFAVEPFRGDLRFAVSAFSIGQLISLGLFVLGCLVLAIGWRTQPLPRHA